MLYPLPDTLLASDIGLNQSNLILAYRGSVAHGMFVSNSDPHSIDDVDLIGLCVPPISYYFGLSEYGSAGTKEIKQNEWDVVVYEVRKAIRLLAQGNPNLLALLWLDDEHYIHVHSAGDELIRQRDLFSTNRLYDSFIGYAWGQLHKMTTGAYNGFMGEKRKRLVDQFGFDTKNAAHTIRLLRMACEFFEAGEFIVNRQQRDADELLRIKRGEWSLERVQREATLLFRRAELAFAESKHPAAADMETIEKLCVSIVREFLQPRGHR